MMGFASAPEGVTKGGINAKVAAWLERRSAAFAKATSRPPGKAMTYGAQKKEAGR